jgi:3-hydroxyacyl-[acyl-carrier-protein] dehydratase
MVLENFYTIENKELLKENSYSFNIAINNKHPIFEGHFPDNPIMPGVCMMQITKDIVEDLTDSRLFMKKCSNVKFMAIINPEINKELNLKIDVIHEENGDIKVKNITKFEETIALKLTAIYKKV